MDVELLSRMVGELILDHDTVGLPGLGAFVAEVVPASFSDRGYTINPPYRRLVFRSGDSGDGTLVRYYAESNDMPVNDALAILKEYCGQLKENLSMRKTVALPGLGRLRATKENTFFFIADEDLDIYPDGMALEPVSLKTHVETPEELSSAVSSLSDMIGPRSAAAPQTDSRTRPSGTVQDSCQEKPAADSTAPDHGHPDPTEIVESCTPSEEATISSAGADVPAEAAETAAAAPSSGPAVHTALHEHRHGSGHHSAHRKPLLPEGWWKVPAIVLGSAAFLLLVFVVLARVAPNFIDTILYTPEELRIINY